MTLHNAPDVPGPLITMVAVDAAAFVVLALLIVLLLQHTVRREQAREDA